MTGLQAFSEEAAPIDWHAEPWLSVGRPTLLFGAKDSAKSLVAQDLLLATAYGRSWLSCIPIRRRGPALYLDYEAKVPTHIRLRQLADFPPDHETLTNIRLYNPPPWSLTDKNAEQNLVRVCTGLRLLVVDSLAAAAGGLKENDTEMRSVVDLLTRVSLQTGAAVVLVHHEGHDAKRARGSSAILQGCGAEIRMSQTNEGFTMTCVSPGPSGERPEPVDLELRAQGGIDPQTQATRHIYLRPSHLMPSCEVVPLFGNTGRPERRKPARGRTNKTVANGCDGGAVETKATDADLVARARTLFGDQVPGVRKLREALQDSGFKIGTTRAKRVQGLLRGAP